MTLQTTSVLILLLVQTLTVGCVGIAVSVPYSSVTTKALKKQVDLSDSQYLPREVKDTESVIKNIELNEVRYESLGSGCSFFLVFIPMWLGDCQNHEVWTFSDSNSVVIKKHSHHLFGFWCSPVPIAPLILTWDAETGYGLLGSFPFCALHLGSKLNTKRYL